MDIFMEMFKFKQKNSERNLRRKWNLFLQIKDKYIPIYVSIQFVNFLSNSCANYEYKTSI